jgi:hypothetical protein
MATPVSEIAKPSVRSPLAYILTGSASILVALALYLSLGFPVLPGFGFFLSAYTVVFVSAVLGLAGVVMLLIGVVAAGVRLAMRSSDWPTP